MARSHTGWSQKWIAAAGVAVIAVLALCFRGEAQGAHQHRPSDHPQEANLPPHGALAKPATHRDPSQNESSSLLLALEALCCGKAGVSSPRSIADLGKQTKYFLIILFVWVYQQECLDKNILHIFVKNI
jgi:hypothetical protein